MPANIEIKARVRDLECLRSRAEKISTTPCETIDQEDIFFQVPTGRLKLRSFPAGHAELIFYQREDTEGPKRSTYQLVPVEAHAALKAALTAALGVRGVVAKRRWLYLAGQTRIHLDSVAGLGDFMELEVVLRPTQTDAEGAAIAAELMAQLGVASHDLIEGAYIDLILAGATAPSGGI